MTKPQANQQQDAEEVILPLQSPVYLLVANGTISLVQYREGGERHFVEILPRHVDEIAYRLQLTRREGGAA